MQLALSGWSDPFGDDSPLQPAIRTAAIVPCSGSVTMIYDAGVRCLFIVLMISWKSLIRKIQWSTIVINALRIPNARHSTILIPYTYYDSCEATSIMWRLNEILLVFQQWQARANTLIWTQANLRRYHHIQPHTGLYPQPLLQQNTTNHLDSFGTRHVSVESLFFSSPLRRLTERNEMRSDGKTSLRRAAWNATKSSWNATVSNITYMHLIQL